MEKSVKSQKMIDFTETDVMSMGTQIRKMKFTDKQIGTNLRLASKKSKKAVYTYTRGLILTQQTKEQFITEGKQLFNASIKLEPVHRKAMMRAVMEESREASSLFIIHNISELKKTDARACMKDFLGSGGKLDDIASWLQLVGGVLQKHQLKDPGTAKNAIDALVDAAEWVVNQIEDAIDAIVEGVDAVLDALEAAGKKIAEVFRRVAKLAVREMSRVIAALKAAGKKFAHYAVAVYKWSYKNVRKFVQAAYEAAISIKEMLETAISDSYYVLRRFVNGIVYCINSVKEIMDFVFEKIGDAADNLWRDVLNAIRYAKARMEKVLDWMYDQATSVMENILTAWVAIREKMSLVYEWAADKGGQFWSTLGGIVAKIHTTYVEAFVAIAKKAAQLAYHFTHSLLKAGATLANVFVSIAKQTTAIFREVIKAALDAGITIGKMCVAVIKKPSVAFKTFVESMKKIGKTLKDVFHDVIDTAKKHFRIVLKAFVTAGELVRDILNSVKEMAEAILAEAIIVLFKLLGTYRRLNKDEVADARSVFGRSLKYSKIYLSREDRFNEIVFGVQDFFSENPDSRAFVTGNIINFDPSDHNFDRPTLIHELTHVWQYKQMGGVYLAKSVWAQIGNDDAYNYGYRDKYLPSEEPLNIKLERGGAPTKFDCLGSIMGEEGEGKLMEAKGDLSKFNPEQQGQIIMHWFVRSHLEITDMNGNIVKPDYAAWNPYRKCVYS